MTGPAISVLIDAHNHERYIERCVLSAVEQDFAASDYEILVVDDGSTDLTARIVRKFAPRVRLLSKKNGGQASAFNAGLREIRSEAVALLDGDDWFAPGKLATVAAALEREPDVVAVSHGYYEVHEPSGATELYLPPVEGILRADSREQGARVSAEYRSLHIGALTVRMKFLSSILPIAEDLVFCADHPIGRSAAAMGVYLLRQPLFYYRFHEQNLFADKLGDVRRALMYERSWHDVERALKGLGVSPEVLATLLYEPWAFSSRARLHDFGGSSLEVIRTEARLHRFAHPSSGALRRALACAPATAALFLSPKYFYKTRDWAMINIWFPLLELSRPVRHALGIKKSDATPSGANR